MFFRGVAAEDGKGLYDECGETEARWGTVRRRALETREWCKHYPKGDGYHPELLSSLHFRKTTLTAVGEGVPDRS